MSLDPPSPSLRPAPAEWSALKPSRHPIRRVLTYVCLISFLFFSVRAASPDDVEEVDLLAFGDWGWVDSEAQRMTAKRMVDYAHSNNVRFDAALLLGDNFYGKLPGGASDQRWQIGFEQMYDAKTLSMPFYAALGNHDYDSGKLEAELAYAKQNPESRWKLPARWYRVEVPAERPLVSVLVLDSNAGALDDLWTEQLTWLGRELSKPRPGKWVIAIAHHPLFSNGEHGDSEELLETWAPLFKKHRLDFFLSGHDHQLEHLEVDGWPISFLVSGGGGAPAAALKRDDRGPFSRTLHGFLHLRLTPDLAIGKFIAADGKVAHEFTRSAGGTVQVVQTTGRDRPGKTRRKD